MDLLSWEIVNESTETCVLEESNNMDQYHPLGSNISLILTHEMSVGLTADSWKASLF